MSCWNLVLAVVALTGEPADGSDAAAARQAVEKSLAYLQAEGLRWKEEKKCASCHHVPFMLWAMSEAGRAGFAVDAEVLDSTIAWTLAEDNAAKVFPDPADTRPEANRLALATVYLALGLQASTEESPGLAAGRERLASHIESKPEADGSWVVAKGRPPLIDSPEVTTLLILNALRNRSAPPGGAGEAGADATSQAYERALEFLGRTSPGDGNQALALRLALFARRAGDDQASAASLAAQLAARQNPDGGWSQTADMASDAFATGQSLYALAAAGGSDREAIGRGVRFLVSTQAADGSWPMTSRPIEPEGKGAGNLAPITYAGTAWAAIGILRSLSEQ
jgi:squalene-hopene/tetraprenyl-beta-curcumene cyclase